ncbi:MAG: Glycosyltransferase [Candidatus Magasanikbacteria bacterium GW2011_GWC2_41_17]|uniref:Glycosyltransferase n=2 Tax=Candidatus Magasanikiibacteriota TaxID=1752731 RepID=A0A0G0WNL7_9BACT|nr:MAG: Glycosyltransferase [Candidatus Magasanikbacteria bacterium GW2011_GWC2_41_17]KKS13657.1 MAG: Glycosyltransferase [Candidatus Magasanikbacteria bacterium GW2011_GWA2_41_55]
MKIFFVTPKLNFLTSGGTTDEYDLTYRTLQDLGHEIFVCTTHPKANNIPYELPYTVIEEDIKSGRMLGIQKGAFRILRKYSNQADIFFVDGQVFLYGAGLYRLLGGKVPVVGYFNRELTAWPGNVSYLFPHKKDSLWWKFKKFVRFYFERYFLMPLTDYIDIIGFANSCLTESYRNFRMKIDSRCFIYGDPFDYRGLMKKHDISEDTYSKRNKMHGPYTLLYSSKMAPGKGFDLVLIAFSKIKNKDNFHLVLGGDGPEEKFVRKMIHDLHLEQYVELPGWMTKEDLYNRFKLADIYVQAHWRKDLTAMSLMTAIMFGLPSIIPGGGGLEWVARNSALYFEDNDPDDLARKIEQLGDDYQLRQKLSQQCYIRMDEPELNHRSRIAELDKRMKEVVANIKKNT